MPEEINRLVTDQLADLLFTPSEDGDANLRREGIAPEKIFRVGNVMIDSLVKLLPRREREPTKISRNVMRWLLCTAPNVDDDDALKAILESLLEVSRELTLFFPTHPRTRKRICDLGLNADKLRVLDPLPYMDFLALQSGAQFVITDSGGIQEETTYWAYLVLTLRENTERPITVSMGTNVLVGRDPEKLRRAVANVLAGRYKKGNIPPLGMERLPSESPMYWSSKVDDKNCPSFPLI